jgi:hypothetical protein
VPFFRSVVPFTAGAILITNAADSPVAGWILNVTSVALLIWLTIEELGSWLRSRQQRRASAYRG